MILRQIGTTGPRVSQIGLGTWPLAGNDGLPGYGALDPERAEATVQAAVEAGISVFETANVYGDGFAERLLGRLIPDDAGQVVCTKGGFAMFSGAAAFTPEALVNEFEASCERLNRQVIDVYLLHNPPPHLIGLLDVYRPLLKLRDQGRLRHLGVAVRASHDGWLALDRPEISIVQLPYNILQCEADDGFLEAAARYGKAVLARETLVNGLLPNHRNGQAVYAADDFRSSIPIALRRSIDENIQRLDPYRHRHESWVDFALRFVLDRPEIACAVVGARRPEQIKALKTAGLIHPSAASG